MKIVTKPGFVQLKRSLMLHEWFLKNLRKLKEKWREQMLEGALPEEVWSTFLRSKAALELSAQAVPCCRAPQDKDPEPCRSLQTPKENLS